MKLFTLARTERPYSPKGDDYGDVQLIRRHGPHFPPVFLSRESAAQWQTDKTNPLKNEDILDRFHWGECQIVDLELQAGLVTNVEKFALDLARSLMGEEEDSVGKALNGLVEALRQAGMMA